MVRIVLSDGYYYIYVLYEWAMLLRYCDVKEGPCFVRVTRMTNDLFYMSRIFIYALLMHCTTRLGYFTCVSRLFALYIFSITQPPDKSLLYHTELSDNTIYSLLSFESYTIFFSVHCRTQSIQLYKTQCRKICF